MTTGRWFAWMRPFTAPPPALAAADRRAVLVDELWHLHAERGETGSGDGSSRRPNDGCFARS